VAQEIESGLDPVIDVFRRMEHFFRRIEKYSEISTTDSMKEMNGRIVVTVLSVLAIVTEGIKQGRTSEFISDRYMIFLLTHIQNGTSRSW
jgi:hypothetical protein